MQQSCNGNLLGVLLNIKESCDALGLACTALWKGSGAAVSVSPIICDHLHFTDEGLKAPTCARHLLSYLYLKLGVKPFGPSWETESLSVPTAGMIASTLNVSQAAEISYNVGIIPLNIATPDGGQDLRRYKELGQRREARRGSWRAMRRRKKKSNWLHHIAWIGPVHVD